MIRLGLRLLGGFLLQADARPRPLPARKAQALLAYLAVRAGRAHARDTLTGLLWGDVRERQARQSLRQAMVRLRRALAGRPRALVVQGDTVMLDARALECDVAAFERAIRRGTPEALEQAMALYRGPLLDGVHVAAPAWEEWLQSERARLGELALEALRRLVEHHLQRGRLEASTLAATRALALDPLQEDMHRALMRLHVRQGRRPAALRQYQTCVAVLQKELGVEPEAATKRLYLEVLQTAAAPARRTGSPLPAADTPLVGRDAEVERLRQRLSAAVRGQGGVLLVTGEAGIGKSRLLHELTAAALARGARVLVGRAFESEQILPFRPWVEALRQALALLRDAPGGPSPRRGELARVFPELSGDGAPPPITAAGHLRLFESLDGVIAELARAQPLVVLLEDVQWADEMSLRLLAFVGRRLVDRPVLLAVTARDEDLVDTPPLARTLDELTPLPHVEHVRLGPLSRSATTALVRALARSGSTATRLASTTDRVWAVSEGNPFVVVETMRALRDRRGDVEAVELPQRVREVIVARLARLGPRAQELARLASVFGGEFEFPVLRRASGLNRRETAAALEELVRRRIVHAVGERFDFTHARLRQAVYEGLLGPRRQALHGAVGEAVEAVYAERLDEVYDRLADHFSRADEPGRAVTYLVQLADKTARSYALDDAVRILHEALAATDRMPRGDAGRVRLGVLFRLAHVLPMLGRTAEARTLLLEHEALVDRLQDAPLSGRYHFWLAYTYGNLGDPLARRHAQRALEEAARAGDELTMGKASYALARESYMLGRPRDGIAQGRHAVALLERSDEPWWLAQALGVLGIHLLHIGDFLPALASIDRMRELGEAMGDARLQTEAAWCAGRVHTVMGNGEAAVAACRRAVSLAPDPVARAIAAGWLGAAHVEAGDVAAATPLLEDAVGRLKQLSSTGGYRYGQVDAALRALLAEAALLRGAGRDALGLAEDAHAVARAGGWGVAVGYAERALGRALATAGRLHEAEAAVDRSIGAFAAIEAGAQLARSHLVAAELRATRGDKHAAAAALRLAHGVFSRLGAPRLVDRAARLADALGVPLETTNLVFHDRVPDIEGQVCSALFVQAHYYRGQLVSDSNVLFLQLEGNAWQRVFIDAGVVFWQTVNGLDSPDQDRHHYTLTDLGAAHGLAGKPLAGVTSVDLPSGGELRLVFAGAPSVALRHVDGRSQVVVG
jgi:DNA-binding SARP family transcriptional activator